MRKDNQHIDPADSFSDNAIKRGKHYESRRRRRKVSFWMLFGVGVLILLLLVWLTIADLWGDTDVAADFISFFL